MLKQERLTAVHPISRFLLLISLPALLITGCSKATPEEVFQEAIGLIQQKNFTSARHRLEELVKDSTDPDLICEARLIIADCFSFDQKPDDAEAIFKQIAEQNPKTQYSWRAHMRLGDMAVSEKRLDEAEGYFKAAIEDTTEEGPILTAMNNLVRTYTEGGKPEPALQTLRDMLALAKNPEHKVRIGVTLVNLLLEQKKRDEAWTSFVEIYDPKFTMDEKETFFSALIQTVPPAGKYHEAFQFFDSVVQSVTDDESRAQASFYNGLLASATAPYAVSGVTVLKRIHEMLPKTMHGRLALVEAARAVMAATGQFPDATKEAETLFDQAIKGYDDLINDMTIEWFEPQKAAWAWDQVGTIYEMKAQYMESIDDLKAASRTIAEIPKRFKALPQQVEQARRWYERVAYKIHLAESSPEFYWQQVRLARAGKPPLDATEENQAPVPAAVSSATGTLPIAPQQPQPPAQPAPPPAQSSSSKVQPASP